MTKQPHTLLEAKDISIGYPKNRRQETLRLYNHLSFELYSGELTCLLGLNGSGKSTLLRTISRVQPQLAGEVYLGGKRIEAYTSTEISRLLGLVLTEKTSAGGLTVRELVSLGRYPYTGFFGKLTTDDHTVVEKAMNDVQISHKAESYVSELSDGEQQRAMIAKALAQECPLVILDEPTAFLDVANRIEITYLLRRLAKEQGRTFLFSSHDIQLALQASDRLWLLSREKGLTSGVAEDLIYSNILEEYLGNERISFDRTNGGFTSPVNTQGYIQVLAENELYYWIKNLLSRYGYDSVKEEEKPVKAIIEAESPTQFKVIASAYSSSASSFKELGALIKSLA